MCTARGAPQQVTYTSDQEEVLPVVVKDQGFLSGDGGSYHEEDEVEGDGLDRYFAAGTDNQHDCDLVPQELSANQQITSDQKHTVVKILQRWNQ